MKTGIETATSATVPAIMKRPYLERLVLNVSHDCNLRCAYCYADTGAYGAPRTMLSDHVGRRIVDEFLSRFHRIGKIQFFGGEPFLNYHVINSLCGFIVSVCERENVPKPAFTVITNGTVLNDEIVGIINRYGIVVTVSLDGDRAVNDSQRVYAGGKGSYDRIVQNIRLLKEKTGQPLQIEGTYTARHIDMNFSFEEFMSFLAHDLDIHYLHMPWVFGESYHGTGIVPTQENRARIIDTYSAAISASLSSLMTPDLEDIILISPVERALRREFSGRGGSRTHMCPAGSGTLSVGVDGKIFPCFMFTNNAEFEFGQVDFAQEDEFDRRRASFVDRLKIPAGEDGSSFETGSSCAGQNYEINGAIDRVSDASRHIQNALDTYLHRRLAEMRADSVLWEWVQTKLTLNELAMRGGATTC